MRTVTALLRHFRRKRLAQLSSAYHARIRRLILRRAKQLRLMHDGVLTPNQKGAITRTASREIEGLPENSWRVLMAGLNVEVEAERQRLILLHCPPDTSAGLAARASNEEQRRRENELRETARIARELERTERFEQSQKAKNERSAAHAKQQELWRQAAERRLTEVIAHREANPPQPRFRRGQEPLGWKPHMDRGELDHLWLYGVREASEMLDEELDTPAPEIHPQTLSAAKQLRGSGGLVKRNRRRRPTKK